MSEQTKNKKMPEPVSQEPYEQTIPPTAELTDEELQQVAGGTASLASMIMSQISKAVERTVDRGDQGGGGNTGGYWPPSNKPQ